MTNAENTPQEDMPERAAKNPPEAAKIRDADYEDTQPELPILNQPPEEKAAAATDGNTKPSASQETATARPETPPATSNGDSPSPAAREKKSAETPESEAKKPAGRLLPWEPETTPSQQSSDKDTND